MKGGLLQYSGLVTKTKAMQGKLLPGPVLVELAEYENVNELISFLRESEGYAAIYESHEEIQHRAQVEAVIDDSLYADYGKLYRFAGPEAKRGLKILFLRYEINVLKNCLEHVWQGGNNTGLGYLKMLFDRHADFDTEKVTRAENRMELQQALEGTEYESLFAGFAESSSLTYADCATQLDIFYYNTAWQMAKRLKNKQMREMIFCILGTEIDWQNIMWMYRYKRFFDGKMADIYDRMIPIRYRLKKEQQRQLLESGPEEFASILGQTAYFTEKDAVVRMGDEITYREVMNRTYRQICRKYPMSLAPVLCYLHDKEQEIDSLTTILEGVRYQVPAKEIQELVLQTR